MEKFEHPYCAVNMKSDKEQYLYDSIDIEWGNQEKYAITKKLGRGKYSHVFQGVNLSTNQKVAIKVLVPIKPEKIKREYHIMKHLNHPNIVKIQDIVKCSHLRTSSLIFEYVPHVDLRELTAKFCLADIKNYMKQLFYGLDYMHSKGIMHRDIKPHNLLVNPETKNLKIIDMGLSQYYFPTNENNTKVASLYYKAPELLFGNSQYDYRIDCWAAGLILAGLIFKKLPFIVGTDGVDQILKVSKLMGTKEIVSYIKQYRLTEKKSHKKDNICFDILIAFEKGDVKPEKPSTFQEFRNESNQQLATWQAMDLIKKLVVLDYKKRFTAKQALQHPFFD